MSSRNLMLIFAPFAAIFGLIYYLKLRKRTHTEVMIKNLIIYPIKSLRGVQVNQLTINKHGASYGQFRDRSLRENLI